MRFNVYVMNLKTELPYAVHVNILMRYSDVKTDKIVISTETLISSYKS